MYHHRPKCLGVCVLVLASCSRGERDHRSAGEAAGANGGAAGASGGAAGVSGGAGGVSGGAAGVSGGAGGVSDAGTGQGGERAVGATAGSTNMGGASGGERAVTAGVGAEDAGRSNGGASGHHDGSSSGAAGRTGEGGEAGRPTVECTLDEDCAWPPSDYCIDADTLRDYSRTGTCEDHECLYTREDTACPHGCLDSQCLGCTTDDDCGGGEWCAEGECEECHTDAHCGESCVDCREGSEICGRSGMQCISLPDCAAGTAGYDCEVCVRFVDASAPKAGADGLAWATAFPSVQQAAESASQAVESGDVDDCEVWVAQGTYYVWGSVAQNTDHHLDSIQLLPHVQIYGGFSAAETDVALDRRDWLKNVATLSGYEDDSSTNRVYHVVASENLQAVDDSVLDGFTITGGAAVLRGEDKHHVGGGLRNLSSSPRIANCLFTRNQAQGAGAIANHRATGDSRGSSPLIENCLFLDNEATMWEGGAIQNWGDANPVIVNSVFVGNVSNYEWADSGGGAIYNTESEPTVVNCTFTRNTAASGSGNAVFNAVSTLTMTNDILWHNGVSELLDDADSHSVVSFSIVEGGFAGANVLDVDPRFVATDDVHLSPNSPAIDAGTSHGDVPDVDMDYRARPQGGGYDLGAYEYPVP